MISKTSIKILLLSFLVLSCENKTKQLVEVAYTGNVKKAKQLLSDGAEINPKEEFPPLLNAIKPGNVKMVTFLLESGANVNVEAEYTGSAIFCAAETGDTDIIEVLIKFGADINKFYKNTSRPIVSAIENGNYQAVELLLKNKAIYNEKVFDNGYYQYSALDYILVKIEWAEVYIKDHGKGAILKNPLAKYIQKDGKSIEDKGIDMSELLNNYYKIKALLDRYKAKSLKTN